MIKTKKVLLGSLATVAMVATPIAAVVSCGPNKKATEAKMDPFQAKLEALPQKGQSVSEYKASVIDFIKSHYAKSKGVEFAAADLKTVTDAKTADAIKTAAEAISGIKKEMKEVNTVLTINGKDYDFGKFLSDEDLSTAIQKTTLGNAAVKAKPEVKAKDATVADKIAINAEIDNAKTKQAILEILKKYTLDKANANDVVVTTVSNASDVTAAITAAKALTGGLFNRDAIAPKAAVAAKKEVATVLSLIITKSDGKTETKKVNLGKFVDMSSQKGPGLSVVAKFKRGQAKQAATTTSAAIGQQVIAPIFSLDDYATNLIALFTSDKTIFTDKEKKTSFKADDEFMKKITDAAKKDGATGATVLAAAKAVKFFR